MLSSCRSLITGVSATRYNHLAQRFVRGMTSTATERIHVPPPSTSSKTNEMKDEYGDMDCSGETFIAKNFALESGEVLLEAHVRREFSAFSNSTEIITPDTKHLSRCSPKSPTSTDATELDIDTLERLPCDYSELLENLISSILVSFLPSRSADDVMVSSISTPVTNQTSLLFDFNVTGALQYLRRIERSERQSAGGVPCAHWQFETRSVVGHYVR